MTPDGSIPFAELEAMAQKLAQLSDEERSGLFYQLCMTRQLASLVHGFNAMLSLPMYRPTGMQALKSLWLYSEV